MKLDFRPIFTALFLPSLYWTATVIAISLFGYPGVACLTPLAWLLGLPVGLRLAHESDSPLPRVLLESAAAGALLGAWQGLLAAGALTLAARAEGAADGPHPLLLALGAVLLSAPAAAGLSALGTWLRRARDARG